MSEIHKMWEKTGIQGRFDESDFRNNGDRASCMCHISFFFSPPVSFTWNIVNTFDSNFGFHRWKHYPCIYIKQYQ